MKLNFIFSFYNIPNGHVCTTSTGISNQQDGNEIRRKTPISINGSLYHTGNIEGNWLARDMVAKLLETVRGIYFILLL